MCLLEASTATLRGWAASLPVAALGVGASRYQGPLNPKPPFSLKLWFEGVVISGLGGEVFLTSHTATVKP